MDPLKRYVICTQFITQDKVVRKPQHKLKHDRGDSARMRHSVLTWRNSLGDVPDCLRSTRRELTTGCFRTVTLPGIICVVRGLKCSGEMSVRNKEGVGIDEFESDQISENDWKALKCSYDFAGET